MPSINKVSEIELGAVSFILKTKLINTHEILWRLRMWHIITQLVNSVQHSCMQLLNHTAWSNPACFLATVLPSLTDGFMLNETYLALSPNTTTASTFLFPLE